MIWGYLIHLSYNMWSDGMPPDGALPGSETDCFDPRLRCDSDLWAELTGAMADAGVNALAIDLGDGVRWASHPEIAVQRAWSTARLRRELARLRRLGIEPLPKLNFSTCHDAWLGPYARMVSTPAYYQVCRDLIGEVVDLFDGPRLFHLGMDEETAQHQRRFLYTVIRQFDLWWEDLLLLVEAVEKAGSRAWVWSDYVWHNPEWFYERMPAGVLQSNWYYRDDFSISPRRNPQWHNRVRAYSQLDAAGYEQVPTGSNYVNDTNFEDTVDFCRRRLAPERLAGFLQAPWRPTLPAWRQTHLNAVAQVRRARAAFEGRSDRTKGT